MRPNGRVRRFSCECLSSFPLHLRLLSGIFELYISMPVDTSREVLSTYMKAMRACPLTQTAANMHVINAENMHVFQAACARVCRT